MKSVLVRSGTAICALSGHPFIWLNRRHPAHDEVDSYVEASILSTVEYLVSFVTNTVVSDNLGIYVIFAPREVNEE